MEHNQADGNGDWGIATNSCGGSFSHNSAHGNGLDDLLAASDPSCNSFTLNQAGTASPSLALWDVEMSIQTWK